MKKNHQTLLLGALGLSAVLASVYAVNKLPIFASANSSGDVDVKVKVVNSNGIYISSIKDGQVMYDHLQEVEATYSDVWNIRYVLTYTKTGESVEFRKRTLADQGDPTVSGTDNYELSVKDHFGKFAFGTYILSAYNDANSMPSDTVSFVYKPYKIENTGEYDEETGNPIVEITTSPEVDKLAVMVTDLNGNEIYKKPVLVDTSVDIVTRYVVDLDGLDAKSGDYQIFGVTAYDRDDNPIDGIEQEGAGIDFEKVEPVPEIPNTGASSLFEEMNLTKADIMSALIVLFVASIFVAFSILKRTGRKSSEKR
ncbi:MAG: hypothetical protein Q4E47_00605 [Candidatus Saccharibacteria bacterium]|nr:hypothetical protein [Candidatus Saccharibacteria bacterium]